MKKVIVFFLPLQRLLEVIIETVIVIANLFGLADKEVLKVAVCHSDELAHVCRTFKEIEA